MIGDGPKLRFGGDFASDFPNRRRLDDLYAEAQVCQYDCVFDFFYFFVVLCGCVSERV